MTSFAVQKLFSLNRAHLFLFVFISVAIGDRSKRILPHTCQNGNHQSLQITNISEEAEKRNPNTLLVGMLIGSATIENSVEVLQETKYRTTIAVAIIVQLLSHV